MGSYSFGSVGVSDARPSTYLLNIENVAGADMVIEARGLKQITDAGAIEQIIDDVIQANPTQLEQYRSGKDKLFGFFVGQVMKATGGKANPAQVNDLLKSKLQG